jgi:hypothetical protein
MTALSGQVVSTLYGPASAVAVQATWFFNPASGALRNNPAAWTDGAGKTWAAGTGALIAANETGKQVRVVIYDGGGNAVRQVKIPNKGASATVAQLAAAPPPDGPFTTAADFNGLTFDLS